MKKIVSFDVGLVNFAYAIILKNSKGWLLHDWGVISLVNYNNKKESKANSACLLLNQFIETKMLQHFKDCDRIYVEQQHTNAKLNCVLARHLWSFCSVHKAIDLKKYKSISPNKKFSKLLNKPLNYKQRKQTSVKWLTDVVAGGKVLTLDQIEFWQKLKKKDDIADAVMQAVLD